MYSLKHPLKNNVQHIRILSTTNIQQQQWVEEVLRDSSRLLCRMTSVLLFKRYQLLAAYLTRVVSAISCFVMPFTRLTNLQDCDLPVLLSPFIISGRTRTSRALVFFAVKEGLHSSLEFISL